MLYKQLLLIVVKKYLLTTFLFLILVFSPKFAFAEESLGISSPSATIQVNGVANIIDRVRERLELFLKFNSESKADYHSSLMEKRLAELEYIVESGQGDRIEETSSRYSSYLGRFSNFVIDKKMKDKKDEILKMYDRHFQVLDKLERNFEFGTGLWRLIEYDKDTVKIFLEKLKEL